LDLLELYQEKKLLKDYEHYALSLIYLYKENFNKSIDHFERGVYLSIKQMNKTMGEMSTSGIILFHMIHLFKNEPKGEFIQEKMVQIQNLPYEDELKVKIINLLLILSTGNLPSHFLSEYEKLNSNVILMEGLEKIMNMYNNVLFNISNLETGIWWYGMVLGMGVVNKSSFRPFYNLIRLDYLNHLFEHYDMENNIEEEWEAILFSYSIYSPLSLSLSLPKAGAGLAEPDPDPAPLKTERKLLHDDKEMIWPLTVIIFSFGLIFIIALWR
jgi:hypothetical protein